MQLAFYDSFVWVEYVSLKPLDFYLMVDGTENLGALVNQYACHTSDDCLDVDEATSLVALFHHMVRAPRRVSPPQNRQGPIS